MDPGMSALAETGIWYTRCPVPNALSIAINLGLLDEEFAPDGVAVRSLAVTADPAARQGHFSQLHPNLFRHGGNIPPLVARSRGADVRVIGLSWTDFYEPVLALPESGIETAADLRGRRLALPRRIGDAVDFWYTVVLQGYERALATAGLTLADVELVDIPVERSAIGPTAAGDDHRVALFDAQTLFGQQREVAVALLTGKVDAIFSHATLAVIVQGITGARVVVDVGALPDPLARVNNGIPMALTVTGDLLESHPEAVTRVLARVLEAADWAREEADAARAIIADEIGLPARLVDLAHGPDAAARLDVDLSPERVDALGVQIERLEAAGVLDGPVDIDALVESAPLEEARRSRLAIIR